MLIAKQLFAQKHTSIQTAKIEIDIQNKIPK